MPYRKLIIFRSTRQYVEENLWQEYKNTAITNKYISLALEKELTARNEGKSIFCGTSLTSSDVSAPIFDPNIDTVVYFR